MEYRTLGRTKIEVSEIGFGCGSVGGLMIRGEYSDMVRSVAWAIEQGITYFDTAKSYGDGQSEINLGKVLKELNPDVVVGTKVSLRGDDLDRIEDAVTEQIEGCLNRLDRDCVDIIYLHNTISQTGRMSPEDVAVAAHALQEAVSQGKARCWGLNGLGDTDAIHEAVRTTHPFVIQNCYNMLNPSSGQSVSEGFPFQNYNGLLDVTEELQIGVVAIRVLAAGALSGAMDRHEIAMPNVGPIGSGADYAQDVSRAQAFEFLVQEGVVENLVEAAIRFAISNQRLSTALVGLASFEQLENAVVSANKGALPKDVLERIEGIQGSWSK